VSADGNIVRALIRGLVAAGAEVIRLELEDDGSVTLRADGDIVLRGLDLWALRASIGDWKRNQ
jgi:hypothetical protein